MGQKLVTYLDQPAVACQGLIRLAIKDYFNNTPRYLRVDQWVQVLSLKLSSRLSKIRMDDYQIIADSVVKDFLEYQAHITT
ncbi:MAG: hypothetical protein INQ03_17895 [Candidatus Heimdallarchaeota archaeon]|nr:hypothetical protein [Candidatus Heimdallarchaeota archaeon]